MSFFKPEDFEESIKVLSLKRAVPILRSMYSVSRTQFMLDLQKFGLELVEYICKKQDAKRDEALEEARKYINQMVDWVANYTIYQDSPGTRIRITGFENLEEWLKKYGGEK